VTLHTDIPTRREVEALLAVRRPGCVSVYVPTSPLTTESDVGRIELKNLAREAVQQLTAGGADGRTTGAVEEAFAELDGDDHFWAHQANSLAVFATPEHLLTFRLPNRLSSLVSVADRFHTKPLLRAVTFPQAAFVLALSQGAVRLVEVSPDLPPARVDVPDLPTDAASAVGKASLGDRSADRRVQGSEGLKLRLHQYARRVDAALRGVLAGRDLPLILAATEPLDAIYRAVNTSPSLVEQGIAGNPDTTSDAELAQASRAVLDEVYAAQLAEVRTLFDTRRGQGRASADVVDVARAATFGAVDTVLVDIDRVVPGAIDEETGAVTLGEESDPGVYGVVDEIARRTLLAGGRVLAVRGDEVPDGGPVAAILRYAV
jgi:hypothetical protein